MDQHILHGSSRSDVYRFSYAGQLPVDLANGNSSTANYGSLERVGLALSTNVILALTTSTFQMTFGFFRTNWSTALCVSFAITTIFLVVYLTIQLVLAHHQWFNKIEEEKDGQEANHQP